VLAWPVECGKQGTFSRTTISFHIDDIQPDVPVPNGGLFKAAECAVVNSEQVEGVIGPKLNARTFENQKTEAKIGVRVLNRMTGLGHPSFERTA